MKKIIIMLLCLLTLGCDLANLNKKTIISPYQLEQWEDGKTYYLLGPKDAGWGVLEGTVGQIGWNNKYILVWQNNNGQGSGWRVINTETNEISSITNTNPTNTLPYLKNITPVPVAQAWEKL